MCRVNSSCGPTNRDGGTLTRVWLWAGSGVRMLTVTVLERRGELSDSYRGDGGLQVGGVRPGDEN
jgi:hypothetical protein